MNIDIVIGWLTVKQRIVRFGYSGKEKLKEIKLWLAVSDVSPMATFTYQETKNI